MKQKSLLKKSLSGLTTLLFSAAFSLTAYAAGSDSQARINASLKNNPLINDIQTIVNVLSAGVGVVVVAMIMIGGIQYSIAGDNPTAVTAAKKRITNALIALLAFAFSFAFLQWLIPGGVFG